MPANPGVQKYQEFMRASKTQGMTFKQSLRKYRGQAKCSA